MTTSPSMSKRLRLAPLGPRRRWRRLVPARKMSSESYPESSSLTQLGSNNDIEIFTASQRQWHGTAALPTSIHAGVAKLIASAQLKPMLKPEWYAAAFSTTNSPFSCFVCMNGMLFARNSCGLSRMSLCLMNARQDLYSSGKMLAAIRSNLPWSLGDTPYQTLGAPKWRKFMDSRSASSLCQPKKERHMPKYVIGVVTPAMLGMSLLLSMSRRSRRFHPNGSCASKKDTGVSAPYSGGLSVTLLQNARSSSDSASSPSIFFISASLRMSSSAATRSNSSTVISLCSSKMHRKEPFVPNAFCRIGVLMTTFCRGGKLPARAFHSAGGTTLNMGRSGSFAKTSATNSSNGRSNSFRVGRSTGHHAGSAIAPPASHARSPLPVPRRCSAEAEQLGRVRPSRREARTPGGRWSAGRGVPGRLSTAAPQAATASAPLPRGGAPREASLGVKRPA
mmetsp:Transcript_9097/g.27709  ORF Transcript_9097/g.27709 Transcript_9097/m.27709 type:complete len:449 (+) Transcript_9097:711-2057(+)